LAKVSTSSSKTGVGSTSKVSISQINWFETSEDAVPSVEKDIGMEESFEKPQQENQQEFGCGIDRGTSQEIRFEQRKHR
jgi:hypothetical protein